MYFSAHKDTTSMWTPMECNNKDHFTLFNDPIYAVARKLRPLVPRPISTTAATTTIAKSGLFSSSLPHSLCYCTHNPNIHLPWKHTLLGGMSSELQRGEHKRLISSMPLVSTRWNPTPEQLQALEEMYRRGTRTPSAEQIQQIAAKLRRFGKIEGKNVFYWFQNHKARERQKKRRQLELLASAKKIRTVDMTPETKPTGLSKRCFENEHPTSSKRVPTLSSCSSSTFSEGAECNKKDVWDHIINVGQPKDEINCWKLELSSCIHTRTVQTFTAQRSSEQENAGPSGGVDHTIILPSISNHNNNDFKIIETSGMNMIKGSQTLQLFPIKSIHQDDHVAAASSAGESKFAPNEFIEFLPITKN